MLGERRSTILRELVEEYIRTGEPVSSRAILDRSGLGCSSATVRNELAVLERDGFAAKPHTSAGRVPTDLGYRYYIDHLSHGTLRRSTRTRIEAFFSTMHAEMNRMLKETSDLLSEITHYPAVVVGPGLQGECIRDAHVLLIEPQVLLVVLVSDRGRVSQSLVRLDEPVDPAAVSAAQEILSTRLVGVQLICGDDEEAVEAADLLGDDSEDLPPGTASLLERVVMFVSEASGSHREFYLGGRSRMVSLWEDLAKLHRILALLEREATVLELLGEVEEGTTVRLGTEIAAGEDDLAVVSTPYGSGEAAGRMGVFGPRRMDYRRSIRVVEEISDALGDSLGG